MRAMVTESHRFRVITACSGREFVKGSYRLVPAGYEAEALANPLLEIEADVAAQTNPPMVAVFSPEEEAALVTETVSSSEEALAGLLDSESDEGKWIESEMPADDVKEAPAESEEKAPAAKNARSKNK